MTLHTESAILGSRCGSLGTLEKHLPGIFVCRVEEPAQSLVPRRVELPQVESPLLTQEDQANELTWTTLTSLSFLSTRVWMHVWSPVSSPFLPHDRPFLF